MRGRTGNSVLVVVSALALSCSSSESTLASPSPGGDSQGASSSGTAGSPSEPGASTLHDLCFQKINEYRASKSLPPYARWKDGEACADGQSKKDAETNTPHGAFPGCGELAQNECPGIPGPPEEAIPACLRLMWDEGPGGGHYDNMASTKYTKAACGVFVTANGKIWSVQNFR